MNPEVKSCLPVAVLVLVRLLVDGLFGAGAARFRLRGRGRADGGEAGEEGDDVEPLRFEIIALVRNDNMRNLWAAADNFCDFGNLCAMCAICAGCSSVDDQGKQPNFVCDHYIHINGLLRWS